MWPRAQYEYVFAVGLLLVLLFFLVHSVFVFLPTAFLVCENFLRTCVHCESEHELEHVHVDEIDDLKQGGICGPSFVETTSVLVSW